MKPWRSASLEHVTCLRVLFPVHFLVTHHTAKLALPSTLQSLCGYHMLNGWHVQIQREFHIDDYTYIWILLVFWWAHALYACPRIKKLKWEKDSYIQVWKNPKSFCSEETLAYQDAISICYGWQQALHLQSRVLDCQTWYIAQAIINTLMPIVKQCVLNQSEGYWLLSDALVSTFSLCTMIKANVCKIQALNQPFIQRDFDLEL